MNKLSILRFPDARLRKKGELIKELTPEMIQLGRDMLELMYSSKGVGLAAIQVNQPVRLLVADTRIREDVSIKEQKHAPLDTLKKDLEKDVSIIEEQRYASSDILKKDLENEVVQPLILFNPEVIHKEGEVIFPEGCLSFPSYYAEVKRAEIVTVKALNEKGKEVCIKTDGLLSICLQHEIDHLDGKLFIDHLSPVKAGQLRAEIKKNGYPSITSDQ